MAPLEDAGCPFEDVPLKGADRTVSPDAEKLLLYRENAPSFAVLLVALTT